MILIRKHGRPESVKSDQAMLVGNHCLDGPNEILVCSAQVGAVGPVRAREEVKRVKRTYDDGMQNAECHEKNYVDVEWCA